MSLINDILSILASQNKKQSELCSYLDINTSTMTNWKNRNTDPPAKYIIPICEFLSISPYFLLTGKEKSSSTKLSEDEQELLNNFKRLSKREQTKLIGRAELLAEQAEQKQSVNKKSIQLKHDITVSHTVEPTEPTVKRKHSYYKVSAGTGFDLDDNNFWEEIDIPATPEAKKADFCLTITGDSMEPVYYDGDIVLVKSQPYVNLGQIGIFIIEGSGYIKKFGGDRLISLNEEYDDIMFKDFNPDDIRCSGLVIGRV